MPSARLTLYPTRLRRYARHLSTQQRIEIANNIATDARATAPVLTGAYKQGIGVDVTGDVVRVVDNDDKAIHKEYGTSDTPAHATLTNAASAYGRYRGTRPRR